jgi:hypothetical protein
MTQPQQQCDNERICYLYREQNLGKKRKGPCNISPCVSDIRSKTKAGAPALQEQPK